MPIFIQCGFCGRKLRVRTDLVGKSVRCPRCLQRFVAAAAEGQSAPSGEEGPPADEAGAAGEGPEAVLPPPQTAEEGAGLSSDPTVRRPAAGLASEAGPPLVPAVAITVRPPPERLGGVPPEAAGTAGAAEGEAAPYETPAAKVFLVLGLILLVVVLLGLAGAWWVNAGIRAAQREREAQAGPRPGLRRANFLGRPAAQGEGAGRGKVVVDTARLT
jgi:hypothetical protein